VKNITRGDESLKSFRILQAGGLGALIVLSLSYLLEIIFSSVKFEQDPDITIILLLGLSVLLAQIFIGYWIGKHVDRQLFLHVFLANIIIVGANFIYTYLVYGMSDLGNVPILMVVIAWLISILVKKRRLRGQSVRIG